MCEKWLFNGADMDQGLLCHRFVINKGNALLVDTDTGVARIFNRGYNIEKDVKSNVKETLQCCRGVIPTSHFAHFTGRQKPWMVDLSDIDKRKTNGDLSIWKKHLDELKLEVNSTNIGTLKLGSPLGFFNANFPKGGYKNKQKNDKKN